MSVPKTEVLWATYSDSGGKPKFAITSKPDRNLYYLYELSDGKASKVGKAKTPDALVRAFKVEERIGVKR